MARGGSDGLIAIVAVIALVVMALKYIAIAAGIGLALVGLFFLFKWLYIGWIKDSKADPLFTQAAKEAAKKKIFNSRDFQQRNSLDDDRIKFISAQLYYADIISDNGVLVENQWQLHSIFRQINANESFFETAINDRASLVQQIIEQQIKKESNELTISLLTALRKNIKGEMLIDYLSLKQKVYKDSASQDEIDAITKQINEYADAYEFVNIIEKEKTLEVFESFCSLLDGIHGTRIWSSKHHELTIQRRSFKTVHINGDAIEVPYIDNKEIGFYFYPSFVIITNQKELFTQSLRVCNYCDIEIKTRSYTESKGSWFKSEDAVVAYTTWLHTRKNGSPDLRYSYNPSTTYYHFYSASLSGLRIEIISGNRKAIERIENAFFITGNNSALSRQVSLSDSDFAYLGEHNWKEVSPSGLRLADASMFPAWQPTEITSRTAISSAENSIQKAYSVIRNDFLNGKYYDLSEMDKANYGFVLFFDLISAYNNGCSDIQTLCKELDVLTISCGKTEKLIKSSLEKCFKYGSKPQEDKVFAAAYFSLLFS